MKNRKNLIFKVPGTKNTPSFNYYYFMNTMEIKGVSITKSPNQFYQLLNEWIKCDWEVINKNFSLKCDFKYFDINAASNLTIIFKTLSQLQINNPTQIQIKWYYINDDNDLRESGELFAECFPELKFKFIPYENPLTAVKQYLIENMYTLV